MHNKYKEPNNSKEWLIILFLETTFSWNIYAQSGKVICDFIWKNVVHSKKKVKVTNDIIIKTRTNQPILL